MIKFSARSLFCFRVQQAAPIETSKAKQVQAATSTQQSKEKVKEAKEAKEVKELEKEPMKEMEKYWVLAPLYQSRGFYEEIQDTSILDPQQRQKNTPIGRNNQIGHVTLSLYNTSNT